MNIDQAREYLIKINDIYFEDTTFTNYIKNELAGDFAVEIAILIKNLRDDIRSL